MSRRAQAPVRSILPDPKFNNEMLAKFMNVIMKSGKKNLAQRIVYGAFEKVSEKLEKGESVDPASYYFRMNPMFETSTPKYDWLNRIIAIGTGHRLPDGPIYSIFEVL